MSVTELGEDYLRHGGPDVYDPDGYVRQLSSRYPVDDVESRFLYQAIGAFHADLPDAAAVMLGAAAEHLILILAEAIAKADSSVAARVRKEMNRPALSLLTYLGKYLEDRKGQLPRRLGEQVSTTFLGIASMIRVARNDAPIPPSARSTATKRWSCCGCSLTCVIGDTESWKSCAQAPGSDRGDRRVADRRMTSAIESQGMPAAVTMSALRLRRHRVGVSLGAIPECGGSG